MIEAEFVEAKLAGSNTVMYNLDDGARLKVVVELNSVLKAKETNPDGSNKYHANIGLNLTFIPKTGQTVKVPRRVFAQPQRPKQPPTGQVA
jgi:hypothetical protein